MARRSRPAQGRNENRRIVKIRAAGEHLRRSIRQRGKRIRNLQRP